MMETKTISKQQVCETFLYKHDGCSHENDNATPKMQLRNNLRISDNQYSKTVLEVVNDEKQPLSNRIFAAQNLARLKPEETEDSLIRLVQKKDTRVSYAALKTLALTGTQKAFEALSAIKRLPFKSLKRQRDFALLLIGYRHQLEGTDKILKSLLKNSIEKKTGEIQLRFQSMQPGNIAEVLRQSEDSTPAISLSNKTAFEVKAGKETFYFCFADTFEDPATWNETLKTKQVAGMLLRKEQHTRYVFKHYIALATPQRDRTQISIFRQDGDLFMLADIVQPGKKGAFVISNIKNEIADNAISEDFSIDDKTFVTMNLSFLQRKEKKKATVIED